MPVSFFVSPFNGINTRTCKPRPSSVSNAIRPPSADTLSRIPIKPNPFTKLASRPFPSQGNALLIELQEESLRPDLNRNLLGCNQSRYSIFATKTKFDTRCFGSLCQTSKQTTKELHPAVMALEARPSLRLCGMKVVSENFEISTFAL